MLFAVAGGLHASHSFLLLSFPLPFRVFIQNHQNTSDTDCRLWRQLLRLFEELVGVDDAQVGSFIRQEGAGFDKPDIGLVDNLMIGGHRVAADDPVNLFYRATDEAFDAAAAP